MKDATQIADELTSALPEWNWEENQSALEDMAEFVARSGKTLVVVEDWFARKELGGTQLLLADREHETEQAKLYQNGGDLENRHENIAQFQTHITEVWVPKSVIKGEI